MRIRATVAAVSGALALSALAVPAAQAEDTADSRVSPFVANAPQDEIEGDIKITKVVVNGGKNVVVGTTAAKTFKIAITATDPSGIEGGDQFLWHGSAFNENEIDGALTSEQDAADCVQASATTSTCTVSVTVDPQLDLYKNALAGTWKVWASVYAKDGDYIFKEIAGTARVQRASKLTVNASPEPVVKGKTITITGKLSRANWETSTYAGYTAQPVKLQFRKAGTTTYTTVKTVNTNSTGDLKTTVTAASDGYWRYSFAGTTTTPAISAAGDYLDVR
ncbi:calcium-binding protein [Streptomyces agglomeratus]|uniref:Calcium-binding protein n=1 Tax=Streptomyces agglomeratus TaxID=285458 RepID=A0A1E5P9V2_9ACTN|nr:DUF5707 domain-containing protein [Streptomyces agglomeratus]OEJ26336.1 calcium-binding protein [Streptomyces agglomeratus]OEJ39605.1 calcium-binding protein [Streptomyces agglomeratus]OEJ46011.1 calcium-binding protein [Streptomyces agglomeratus]OEJ52168.1 calcium-binding protein [Streptomyces agglomeratus]OEJ59527.1 calcium-binding protein [Streptomyces agglomeratus]